MRIVVHDFTAFSFPVQLSRELARKGHEVLHLYSNLDPRGGRLQKEAQDPANLEIEAISIDEAYVKYRVVGRARQEWKYSRELLTRLQRYQPDIIFNANTAVSISWRMLSWARRSGSHYVHWTQDIYTLAGATVLIRRFGIFGRLLTRILRFLEASTLNRADAVIVISEDFVTELTSLGISPRRIYTIPNWMPIDEMRPENKSNPWSMRHQLDRTTNLMYVGMLGFKHDTRPFVDLAEHFSNDERVRVVVVGAGALFNELAALKRDRQLDNLVLLGWQDYRDISNVLATADVLIAMVSSDASRFSVPSKILSYLSAQRPVLAAIPASNLAHRMLVEHGIGLAVDPSDLDTLVSHARRLIDDPDLRSELASRGRAYAEENFDIGVIASRFEQIIGAVDMP